MIGKRFRSLPFISANDNYTLSANRNGSYIDCTLDSMPKNDTSKKATAFTLKKQAKPDSFL